MNKLLSSKLYYNIEEDCSYIYYNEKIYKMNNCDNNINEGNIMADMLLNDKIINTCSFYHLINFIFNNEIVEINEHRLNIINCFLLNKEFIFKDEEHLSKLIGIKRVSINQLDYKFIKANGIKFIISVEI